MMSDEGRSRDRKQFDTNVALKMLFADPPGMVYTSRGSLGDPSRLAPGNHRLKAEGSLGDHCVCSEMRGSQAQRSKGFM